MAVKTAGECASWTCGECKSIKKVNTDNRRLSLDRIVFYQHSPLVFNIRHTCRPFACFVNTPRSLQSFILYLLVTPFSIHFVLNASSTYLPTHISSYPHTGTCNVLAISSPLYTTCAHFPILAVISCLQNGVCSVVVGSRAGNTRGCRPGYSFCCPSLPCVLFLHKLSSFVVQWIAVWHRVQEY